MSDARFQEIIEVVLDSKQAEKDAKAFIASWKTEVSKMFRGKELPQSFKSALDEADKALHSMLDSQKSARISAIKESAQAEVAEEKRRAQAIQKINDDVRRADAVRRKQEEQENASAVARQVADLQRATAQEEKLVQQKASMITKINREIAQSNSARIRQEERENAAAVERQMANLRRLEAQQNKMYAQSVKRQIKATAPTGSTGGGGAFTGSGIARGMRAGAGAMGSMGSFQGASALYGMANVASMFGAAEISATALTAVLGPLALAIGGVVGAFSMLSGSKEFTKKLSEMGTLLESATVSSSKFADSLNATAAAAVDMSIKFNRDLIEVVTGFKEALSSGIDSSQLVQFSESAGQLSASLGISFAQSANILTSFKDTYQLSIGDMAHINDILFNTVDVGKVSVDELITNFGRLLPVGRAAGVALTDLAGGVALLTRHGIPTGRAITSMISLLENIVNPSKKAKKAFEELGVEFGQGALAQGIPALIDKIKDATGGNLDLLSALFPERQALRAVAAMTDATDQLKELTAATGKYGTDAVAASRAMDNGVTKFEQLGKAISGEFAIAGRELWDQLANIFLGSGPLSSDTIKDVQSNISEVATLFKYVGITVGGILKIVADFGIAIWDVVKAAGSLFGILTDIVTFDWGNIVNRLKDISNAGVDAAKRLADAALKPGDIAIELGKAYDAGEDRLNRIKDGVTSVADASQSAADKIINHWDNVKNSLDGAGESTEELDRKMEKIEGRELKRHSRKGQEEELKELEDMAEEYSIRAQVAARKITEKVKAELEIRRAKFRAQFDIELQQSTLDSMGADLQRKYEDEDPMGFHRDLALLKIFEEKVKDLKARIMSQSLDTVYDPLAKKAAENMDNFMKDTIAAGEKRKKAREDYEKDVLKTAESYYEKDAKAYEKAQQRKEKALDKIQKKLDKALEHEKDRINKLMNDKADNEISGAAGNPGRKRRIASDQYGAAQEAVDSFLSGGGNSQQEFDRLMDSVSRAADALKSAEEEISGAGRAAKNEEERINQQIHDSELFQQNLKKAGSSAMTDAGRGMPSAPSYQSAAAAAAREKATQIIERTEIVKADIQLNIDGTVSPATIKAIADAVQKTVERNRVNQTRKSDYDPDSYGDTSDSSDSGDDQ